MSTHVTLLATGDLCLLQTGLMKPGWHFSLWSTTKKVVKTVFYTVIRRQKHFCQRSSVLHHGLASDI
jgi:hypothetical protein